MLELIAVSVSCVALLVSIYFSIYSTRPHIRIETDDCIQKDGLLCVVVSFQNQSPVAGEIYDATVTIKGKTINSIKNLEEFDFDRISLKTKGNRMISNDKLSKGLPLIVEAFRTKICVIVFDTNGIEGIKTARLNIYRVGGITFRKSISTNNNGQ